MGPPGSREEFDKKILRTLPERIKTHLRSKKVREDRGEVEHKGDKIKWKDNITSKAEKAPRTQHMKALYGLTKTAS